jgi:hypothetical protein
VLSEHSTGFTNKAHGTIAISMIFGFALSWEIIAHQQFLFEFRFKKFLFEFSWCQALLNRPKLYCG